MNATTIVQTWYSNIFAPSCDTSANGGLGNPSGCSSQTGQSANPGAPSTYDTGLSGYSTTVQLPQFDVAAVLAANPGMYITSFSAQILLTYYLSGGEIDVYNTKTTNGQAGQPFTSATSSTTLGITGPAGVSLSPTATLTVLGTTTPNESDYNCAPLGTPQASVPGKNGSCFGENIYSGLGTDNSGSPASTFVPNGNLSQYEGNTSANLTFNVTVGASNVTGSPTGGVFLYGGDVQAGAQAEIIYTADLAPVPEPATTAIVGSGLIALAALLRRRQKKN